MAFYSVISNPQGGNNLRIQFESFQSLMMTPGEAVVTSTTMNTMMPQIDMISPEFAGQTPLTGFERPNGGAMIYRFLFLDANAGLQQVTMDDPSGNIVNQANFIAINSFLRSQYSLDGFSLFRVESQSLNPQANNVLLGTLPANLRRQTAPQLPQA